MAPVAEAQFEQCVDRLYATLGTPESLPQAMAHVAQLLDTTGASFIRTNAVGEVCTLVCHGFDTSLQQQFMERYSELDPTKPLLLGMRPGAWLQDDSMFDLRRTTAREYVADFAPKAGIRWFRGGKVQESRDGGAFVSMVRPQDGRPFDPAAIGWLDRLYPHFARLARLLHDFDEISPGMAASQAAAEALGTGVCVVDGHLRVVYANRAALGIVGGVGPLQIRSNALSGRSPKVTGQLRIAVTHATRLPRQARSFSPNPDDVLPQRLQLRVLPLDESVSLARATGGPFALLFISRGTSPLRANVLGQLFGLTPSEAELVRLLGQGLSPTICADRRQVSIATVRTQLKTVYAKTGVSSLPQLMSVVLALPGLL